MKMKRNDILNHTNAKSVIFKITQAGMLTAIAVIVAYVLNTTLVIAGIPGLRVSFHGPFLQFVSVVIGPLYGGMAYAVRDLLSFLLRPMPPGFLWQLMVIDFFCGVAIGLLWIYLKKVKLNVKRFTIIFGCIFFALFIVIGIINLLLHGNGTFTAVFSGGNASFVESATWGLISTGFAGLVAMLLCHVLFHFMYRNAEDKEEKLQRAYKLFIAVGIPTMLVTLINSFLFYYVWGFATQALVYFIIVRLIRRVFTIFYDIYVLMILLSVAEKVFSKAAPSLAQHIQRRADGNKQSS